MNTCKYTKYSIIEIVPFELKSKKTPLYTIVNSSLLWLWLISYFIYRFFTSKFGFLYKFFSSKYNQKNKHNESINTLHEDLSEIEYIDLNNETNIINIESTIFKRKHAFKILSVIVEENLSIMKDIKIEDIDKIDSFVLRKDIIEIEFNENTESICGEIILTRSISKPVKMFMGFMNKKIF